MDEGLIGIDLELQLILMITSKMHPTNDLDTCPGNLLGNFPRIKH